MGSPDKGGKRSNEVNAEESCQMVNGTNHEPKNGKQKRQHHAIHVAKTRTGEAFTTAGLVTIYFPLQVAEIHDENVHLMASQGPQELGPA